MFWGSKKLKLNAGLYGTIKPFSEKNVAHGAYELNMGDMYFATDKDTRKKLKLNEMFSIGPGQFALLETKEKVKIPRNAIGLISIKGGIKLRGLVNVSGFHVDPGFEGRLVFSVYNAGGNHIHLVNGEPVFLLWFCDLDEEEDDGYDGNSNKGITANMVEGIGHSVASPAAINERLKRIETYFFLAVKTIIPTILAILTLFATVYASDIKNFFKNLF